MDRELQWPASESNRELSEKGRKRMEDGFSSYSSLYDTSSLLQFCNGKLIMCSVFSLRTDESVMIQVNMLPQLDGGGHLTFMTFFSPSTLRKFVFLLSVIDHFGRIESSWQFSYTETLPKQVFLEGHLSNVLFFRFLVFR